MQGKSGLSLTLKKLVSDEFTASSQVEYLNIGEVIDLMPVPETQRHVLRTRYLKRRQKNMRSGNQTLLLYRFIGVLKTLTGVLVRPHLQACQRRLYRSTWLHDVAQQGAPLGCVGWYAHAWALRRGERGHFGSMHAWAAARFACMGGSIESGAPDEQVPVLISSTSVITEEPQSTMLNWAAVGLSAVGTLAVALEDFFQFGARARAWFLCAAKLDKIFWCYHALAGPWDMFEYHSGDAFKKLTVRIEDAVREAEVQNIATLAGETNSGPQDKDKMTKSRKLKDHRHQDAVARKQDRDRQHALLDPTRPLTQYGPAALGIRKQVQDVVNTLS
jgi:hypothetical protein